MTSLPEPSAIKLGLVIDLDICVGCQACVVNCKEWNTSGYGAPLSDESAYGAQPSGSWLNRVHALKLGWAKTQKPCISQSPACTARMLLVSRLAQLEPPSNARKTELFWSMKTGVLGVVYVRGRVLTGPERWILRKV